MTDAARIREAGNPKERKQRYAEALAGAAPTDVYHIAGLRAAYHGPEAPAKGVVHDYGVPSNLAWRVPIWIFVTVALVLFARGCLG